MRDLDVLGVRVETPTNQPIVLLRERGGERYLPIWIGASEAAAIAFAQQGVVPPRPLTHDLLRDVITALGVLLNEVRIVKLEDKIFFSDLVFSNGVRVSARTSDAIALALRTDSPIRVEDAVLDAAGVLVSEDENDEVERFREFLDSVSPEDFDTSDVPDTPDVPGPRGEGGPPGPSSERVESGERDEPGDPSDSGEPGEPDDQGGPGSRP